VSEMLDRARAICEKARDTEQVEAYLLHDREFQVKVYDGEVESLSSTEPRGVGVRVVNESKTGFAF
jgi:predicted Zn-dependent protease